MRTVNNSTSRAITDYFNSPAWQGPHESDLLAAIMRELMDDGQSATGNAIIARIMARMEREGDEQQLQNYRQLLALLLDAPASPQRSV
ncbi:biofilm development regulator YmgB/AriR family protein [Pantoea sp.]|uniref:biofilm development regulator YmgB/AriR family protein n=1 Tax=Pantoea sp. TaxID=69393 RepID=UPI0031E1CA2D